MRFHPSLTIDSVARHGAARVALMVASEFWRASNDAEFSADVLSCYERARELMGVLEVVPFNDDVAMSLSGLYKKCARRALINDQALTASHVRLFASQAAEAFEEAARRLS